VIKGAGHICQNFGAPERVFDNERSGLAARRARFIKAGRMSSYSL